MGCHGVDSVDPAQGAGVTKRLRICVQAPEIAQPEAFSLSSWRRGLLRYNLGRMRSKNTRLASIAANAILLVSLAPGARAVDAIVLEVRELSVDGVPFEGASARLELLSDQKTRVTLTARSANLPDPIGRVTDIELACDAPVIAEPRFGCDAGMLTGTGGPAGRIDMRVAAEMRTDTGVTSFKGSGLKVAGTSASLDGRLDDKGWQVKGITGTTTVSALRKFAA